MPFKGKCLSGDKHTVTSCEGLARMVLNRLGNAVKNFQLIEKDDGLFLCGQVHSYYAKQLAQEVVMEETSMAIIANQIQVT